MLRATLQRAQSFVVRRQGAAAVAPARMAYFSTDASKPEDTPQAAAEPTKEEKEAHAHEWGIKYNDEALKFEKEW